MQNFSLETLGDDRSNCDALIVVRIKGVSSLTLEYRDDQAHI